MPAGRRSSSVDWVVDVGACACTRPWAGEAGARGKSLMADYRPSGNALPLAYPRQQVLDEIESYTYAILIQLIILPTERGAKRSSFLIIFLIGRVGPSTVVNTRTCTYTLIWRRKCSFWKPAVECPRPRISRPLGIV